MGRLAVVLAVTMEVRVMVVVVVRSVGAEANAIRRPVRSIVNVSAQTRVMMVTVVMMMVILSQHAN